MFENIISNALPKYTLTSIDTLKADYILKVPLQKVENLRLL